MAKPIGPSRGRAFRNTSQLLPIAQFGGNKPPVQRKRSHNCEHGSGVRLIAEIDETFEVLAELAVKQDLRGGAIHDVRIAAICISHDVEVLLTADRDFSRFAALRTSNPFAG